MNNEVTTNDMWAILGLLAMVVIDIKQVVNSTTDFKLRVGQFVYFYKCPYHSPINGLTFLNFGYSASGVEWWDVKCGEKSS